MKYTKQKFCTVLVGVFTFFSFFAMEKGERFESIGKRKGIYKPNKSELKKQKKDSDVVYVRTNDGKIFIFEKEHPFVKNSDVIQIVLEGGFKKKGTLKNPVEIDMLDSGGMQQVITIMEIKSLHDIKKINPENRLLFLKIIDFYQIKLPSNDRFVQMLLNDWAKNIVNDLYNDIILFVKEKIVTYINEISEEDVHEVCSAFANAMLDMRNNIRNLEYNYIWQVLDTMYSSVMQDFIFVANGLMEKDAVKDRGITFKLEAKQIINCLQGEVQKRIKKKLELAVQKDIPFLHSYIAYEAIAEKVFKFHNPSKLNFFNENYMWKVLYKKNKNYCQFPLVNIILSKKLLRNNTGGKEYLFLASYSEQGLKSFISINFLDDKKLSVTLRGLAEIPFMPVVDDLFLKKVFPKTISLTLIDSDKLKVLSENQIRVLFKSCNKMHKKTGLFVQAINNISLPYNLILRSFLFATDGEVNVNEDRVKKDKKGNFINANNDLFKTQFLISPHFSEHVYSVRAVE